MDINSYTNSNSMPPRMICYTCVPRSSTRNILRHRPLSVRVEPHISSPPPNFWFTSSLLSTNKLKTNKMERIVTLDKAINAIKVAAEEIPVNSPLSPPFLPKS